MTQTLTTKVLNDFIAGQGYGVAPSAVEAMARELLANWEAQPVAWPTVFGDKRAVTVHADTAEVWNSDGLQVQSLFTAPPAPAVSDVGAIFEAAIDECRKSDVIDEHAWNHGVLVVMAKFKECRAAMLAQPVSQGYKLVPVEPTEEMIAAAMNCDDVEFNSDETFCVNFDNIYRAMLAAAPEGGNG